MTHKQTELKRQTNKQTDKLEIEAKPFFGGREVGRLTGQEDTHTDIIEKHAYIQTN